MNKICLHWQGRRDNRCDIVKETNSSNQLKNITNWKYFCMLKSLLLSEDLGGSHSRAVYSASRMLQTSAKMLSTSRSLGTWQWKKMTYFIVHWQVNHFMQKTERNTKRWFWRMEYNFVLFQSSNQSKKTAHNFEVARLSVKFHHGQRLILERGDALLDGLLIVITAQM